MLGKKSVKVAVHASYYSVNYGDSLLMIRLAKYLANYNCVGVDFYFPLMAEAVKKDVSPYLSDCSVEWGKPSSDADILVLCGGGYFGEPPSTKIKWYVNFIRRHFFPIMSFVLARKKIYAVGLGAGPVNSRIIRRCMSVILKRASLVFTRDKESGEFVRGLGAELLDKVKDGTDLAQSYAFLSELISVEGESASSKRENKYIAVHLTLTDRYGEKITALLDEMVGAGFNIVFFTDSPAHDSIFEDEKYFLYKYFSRSDVECVSYHGVSSTTQLIHGAGGVITSKLHVGIVSATCGLPILAIPFHPKTYRYYKHVDREFSCIFEDEVAEVVDAKIIKFKDDTVSGCRYSLPDRVKEKLDASLEAIALDVLLK